MRSRATTYFPSINRFHSRPRNDKSRHNPADLRVRFFGCQAALSPRGQSCAESDRPKGFYDLILHLLHAVPTLQSAESRAPLIAPLPPSRLTSDPSGARDHGARSGCPGRSPQRGRDLFAQQPPPADTFHQLSYEQLDQLVAPVALYPDALVAQILAAATFSPQVVEADRFVQRNAGVPPQELARMADAQPWDPSVKALVAFPSVLSQMDRNLDWTTRLGNAYYNQPQNVMDAVQTMRQRAYAAGSLRTIPQETVAYQPAAIVIEPANPAVVYVPVYNPWVVYGAPVPVSPAYAYVAPPPAPGAIAAAAVVAFTVGVVVGAFAHYGWGWGHWGCGWGPHPVIAFNHFTYVSHSVTVINHGYYGGYDHSFAARTWNQHVAYGPHGGVYTDQRSLFSNSRLHGHLDLDTFAKPAIHPERILCKSDHNPDRVSGLHPSVHKPDRSVRTGSVFEQHQMTAFH